MSLSNARKFVEFIRKQEQDRLDKECIIKMAIRESKEYININKNTSNLFKIIEEKFPEINKTHVENLIGEVIFGKKDAT